MLLSHFSRVRLCATPETAAHQAPPSLGFSRQEHEWVAISFSDAWKWKVKVKSLSRDRLLATPWTAAYQAPLSMGFSRQEAWSGVPLPSGTGNSLDYNSATQQNHRTLSSLEDIKVWHTFLNCFYRKQTTIPTPPNENCCPQEPQAID